MRYFILGSCVTRDVFRESKTDNKVVDYYARTTIKSLISKPVTINEIKLESKFQRRMIECDFKKTLFEDIKNSEFDIFIIDLIDERFDIVKVDDSYVTRSSEFVAAGLENIGEKINKSLPDWERECSEFVNRLLSIIPVKNIIIHEAYWAKKYVENGEIKEFPNPNYIDTNNSLLKEYYSVLKKLIPTSVVKFEGDLLGDSSHVWGLSPFHYNDEYYKNIHNQLLSRESIMLSVKTLY